MSDYPMLISNKLHSFRNFVVQSYEKTLTKQVANITFADFSYYQTFAISTTLNPNSKIFSEIYCCLDSQ